MKVIITVLLFVISLSSCASDNHATLSYSAVFDLSIQSEQLSGSAIFYSDELSVKLKNGKLISGKVILCESENLPVDFDIREYPEYIFGLLVDQDVSSEIDGLF